MGILARHRRGWIVIVVGLLLFPLFGQITRPLERTSSAEARNLRRLPSFPQSWDNWVALPRAIDGFLSDHFGFRDQIIHANALVRYALSSPTNRLVVIGRDHWLFYVGDEALEQSLGLVARMQILRPFSDFVANLHRQLSERNIKFLLTIVPNKSTISLDKLPLWASNPSNITEYDITLKLLSERGVPVLDVRPALLAANALNPVYLRTDTHWNGFGAAVTRDEIVAALGHPEWRIDINRSFQGYRERNGGDLARFLGVANDVRDHQPIFDLSTYERLDAPTVLVIGDSFTQNYFPSIWVNGGRLVWMYHARCAFDLSDVLSHNPDIVVFAPTERYASCIPKS
ncbi:MAG: alginate O-acetyltransferase complex protein AlgJ [Alphaproteobacteria bacterium]|jgi:hypothetical protein|nr:alginate O-acetyltransferase complex protein AlgJ [Alphaproteobacteria bacterium]